MSSSRQPAQKQDQTAAYVTINRMRIPVREPHWPYPTKEPYLPCCASPVRSGHAATCTHAVQAVAS
jgi:hypothetical protein